MIKHGNNRSLILRLKIFFKYISGFRPRCRHRETRCAYLQPKEGQQQYKNQTQPEPTENRTVWKSDYHGDKKETFTQTRRRGGDRQLGQRGLVARWWLRDPARCSIVEQGRPGCSWQNAQGGGWQTLLPHIRA